VADRKEGINPEKAQVLRAKALAERGRNWIRWAEKQESEPEREQMLDQANADLVRGVNIYQNVQEDRHADLAYVVRLLGEAQFKREAYDEALKDYDRALSLLNFVEVADKKRSKESGDVLCLKGTTFSFKGHSQ
jgi:tetratricopeptide (TPR) repeat protein